MRRHAAPIPGRPGGVALVAVLAHLTLIFMVWSLANRQSASTMALEEVLDGRAARQAGIPSALAFGVFLLETGTPDPSMLVVSPDTYRCYVEIPAGSGDRYTLTYVEVDAEVTADPPVSRWTVSVSPYDPINDLSVQGPITAF